MQYADPGDEDEERPTHRMVARRALDALNTHCRLCGICLVHGAKKCKLASAFELLVRSEARRAGIRESVAA